MERRLRWVQVGAFSKVSLSLTRRVGRRDRDGALRCRCFVVKGHFDSPTSESLVHISGFFNTLPSPDPHRVTVGSDVPVQIGSNPAECCSFPMRIG